MAYRNSQFHQIIAICILDLTHGVLSLSQLAPGEQTRMKLREINRMFIPCIHMHNKWMHHTKNKSWRKELCCICTYLSWVELAALGDSQADWRTKWLMREREGEKEIERGYRWKRSASYVLLLHWTNEQLSTIRLFCVQAYMGTLALCWCFWVAS